MSTRRQLDRAVRRATDRDRKRRPRMKVAGKATLRLAQLVDRPRAAKRR